MVRYRSGCHSPCSSVVVLTAAYSVLQAASLISPLLCSALRASATSLRISSIRFSRSQSTGCPCLARLLVAAGCGWIVWFASASLWRFSAVALCTRSTPCFPSNSYSKHAVPLPTYAAKGYRSSNHLFAPPLLHSQAARKAWSVSATRYAIAPLIAATVQPSGSRLFFLCGIFPVRIPPNYYVVKEK